MNYLKKIVGGDAEFEKVIEEDPEQNVDLQITLIDGTNVVEKKNEATIFGNRKNKKLNQLCLYLKKFWKFLNKLITQ